MSKQKLKRLYFKRLFNFCQILYRCKDSCFVDVTKYLALIQIQPKTFELKNNLRELKRQKNLFFEQIEKINFDLQILFEILGYLNSNYIYNLN